MSNEQKYNGLKILSNISGLGESDIKQIWEEVKENIRLRDSCPRPHDFQVDVTMTEHDQQKMLRCTTCKATIQRHKGEWYKQGLEDAGRGVTS